MKTIDNYKGLSSSVSRSQSQNAGASNIMGALSVLQNVGGLASSIVDSQDTYSSDQLTGQEMAKIQSKKNSNITSSAVGTMVSIISIILASCL